jgi:hypothetical protein
MFGLAFLAPFMMVWVYGKFSVMAAAHVALGCVVVGSGFLFALIPFVALWLWIFGLILVMRNFSAQLVRQTPH